MGSTVKPRELREQTDEELAKRLGSLRSELSSIRLKSQVTGVEHPARIGQARREIAQIRTIQRERRHG